MKALEGGASEWVTWKKNETEGKQKGKEEEEEEELKGFRTKDVPKPELYDMAPEDFEEWNELFKARLISQDGKWSVILEWIEKINKDEPMSGPITSDMVKGKMEELK